MKKLIALITAQGKTKKQLVNEVWNAIKKYRKVSRKFKLH